MAVRLEGAEGIKRLFTRGSRREAEKRGKDAQMEYQKSRATAERDANMRSRMSSPGATTTRPASSAAMSDSRRRNKETSGVPSTNAKDTARRVNKETSGAQSTRRAPTRPEAPTRAAGDMTFKQAFAAARKAGKQTFMWQGKKYTTELAKSTPTRTRNASPSRGTPGGVRGRGRK